MIIQKFGSKLKVFPWFKKKHMTSFKSVRHEEIYGKRMWDSENNTDCSYRQIRCFYKAQAFHRHIVSMKSQFTDKVNTGTKQTQKWQNEAIDFKSVLPQSSRYKFNKFPYIFRLFESSFMCLEVNKYTNTIENKMCSILSLL